jgi:hypothetical protein
MKGGCFSENTLVLIGKLKSKKISELKRGDKVLSMNV